MGPSNYAFWEAPYENPLNLPGPPLKNAGGAPPLQTTPWESLRSGIHVKNPRKWSIYRPDRFDLVDFPNG